MKHYVVTNTKVVRETFRVAAASKDDAVRRCMSGDETSYDAELVKEQWVAAPNVSPLKGTKS